MEEARALLARRETAAGLARLRLLSDTGEAQASALLATLHALGASMAKDWSQARRLLALAVEQGSEHARAQLEILDAEGDPDRLPPRQRLCEAPRVRRMDGVLTPAACGWLIDQARGRLSQAATLDNGQTAYNDNRTNSAFAFTTDDLDCISALARHRAALTVQVPEAVIELPQIFHYTPGQEFRPHVDYFPPGGRTQRIATFLIYLNDAFEDGETWFRRPDLKAKAATGGAIYFANVDPSGAPDPLTLHAGLSPTNGEKWLLSQWVHDRPYLG
jgi:hypothetical protein